MMKLGPWALLTIAGVLSLLSRALEAQGDAAPFAQSGVSHERLVFHLPALALLVAALVCFIAALWGFLRRRNRN
jgi:hypothetical protein